MIDIIFALVIIILCLAAVYALFQVLSPRDLPTRVVEQLRMADRIMMELEIQDQFMAILPSNVRNEIHEYQASYNGVKIR